MISDFAGDGMPAAGTPSERRVCSDWWEDRGDLKRAEYLRIRDDVAGRPANNMHWQDYLEASGRSQRRMLWLAGLRLSQRDIRVSQANTFRSIGRVAPKLFRGPIISSVLLYLLVPRMHRHFKEAAAQLTPWIERAAECCRRLPGGPEWRRAYENGWFPYMQFGGEVPSDDELYGDLIRGAVQHAYCGALQAAFGLGDRSSTQHGNRREQRWARDLIRILGGNDQLRSEQYWMQTCGRVSLLEEGFTSDLQMTRIFCDYVLFGRHLLEKQTPKEPQDEQEPRQAGADPAG